MFIDKCTIRIYVIVKRFKRMSKFRLVSNISILNEKYLSEYFKFATSKSRGLATEKIYLPIELCDIYLYRIIPALKNNFESRGRDHLTNDIAEGTTARSCFLVYAFLDYYVLHRNKNVCTSGCVCYCITQHLHFGFFFSTTCSTWEGSFPFITRALFLQVLVRSRGRHVVQRWVVLGHLDHVVEHAAMGSGHTCRHAVRAKSLSLICCCYIVGDAKTGNRRASRTRSKTRTDED
ncbi:hypothetical protein AGLY_012785 [Aphis glycines]|uniref:Uncharacterized protein n=1 Tax=Aphis glycines TaxID=307491 RepID=A0A6G0T831_APHGL|nr:hypothetical protein AGLY_012785 [Aphis glycines]